MLTIFKTKLIFVKCGFSASVTCANLLQEKNYELSELNTNKRRYLPLN